MKISFFLSGRRQIRLPRWNEAKHVREMLWTRRTSGHRWTPNENRPLQTRKRSTKPKTADWYSTTRTTADGFQVAGWRQHFLPTDISFSLERCLNDRSQRPQQRQKEKISRINYGGPNGPVDLMRETAQYAKWNFVLFIERLMAVNSTKSNDGKRSPSAVAVRKKKNRRTRMEQRSARPNRLSHRWN